MTSHERAVEVDTALADLWEAEGTARFRIEQDLDHLHRLDGQKQDLWSGRRGWDVSNEDTEASIRAKLADTSSPLWMTYESGGQTRTVLTPGQGQYAQSTIDDIDKERSKLPVIAEQERPLADEYAADPWSRFFLVLNSGGHIHRTRSCVTTFPSTRWSWLPSLSGLTEADAVAEQGPRLCSVCFPSAPVEWTLGLPKAPKCPGSGKPGTRAGRSSYGACSVCGRSYKLSDIGLIRAHKPAEETA